MNFEDLKSAIQSDNFRITQHALQEKDADNISILEIKTSIKHAEVIEDYPSSKPLPSCLVLSFNNKNEPIHTVWALDKGSQIAILITVYRPNPKKWVEYKKRK
ncbi:MAG: DUF4258 domain-containing protein [Candidatus Melainabacteria bacterium]|nr:DUF4258 domain-containing protein [Candidatus Melainabacteria bacterium]